MNWNELLSMVLESSREKNYEDIQANFNFHNHRYAAVGDVLVQYDGVQDKFYVDVKLYGIYVLNDDNSFGGQQDHPMPEMIRDAQYALQDKANEIAAAQGDFEGTRIVRY